MQTPDSAETLDWLVRGDEPAARWIALTRLLEDRDAAAIDQAHREVLADPRTHELVGRLRDWNNPEPLSGHNSPAYNPNILSLLADMGVGGGEIPGVDEAVEALLGHRDQADRLATPAIISRIGADPVLSSLLCDSHIIVEVLIRFGRADHPVVRRAIDRMAADLVETPNGRAWTCIPSNDFRGPGRKGDICPMVTLEALRALARLPADQVPLDRGVLVNAARTVLEAWLGRGESKPYMFGHGLGFKTVKWPNFWYGTLWLLETLGAYPEVWATSAEPRHRRAIAELAACLIAYNLDSSGRVTPRSCYRGFESFSFGQKKVVSAFATAQVLAALRPFEALGPEIAAVNVLALSSSKGGSGLAVGPRA